MTIKIHFLPPLAAAGLGACLVSILLGLLLIHHADNKEQALRNDYGQAIARLAAKQAVDASFNHDLVRLQVTLQDVMENPHTLLATIHDVQNNLLVQAGSNQASGKGQVYISPINMQDTVAGYLSVTIASDIYATTFLTTPVVALSILFLCFSLSIMLQAGAISWSFGGTATAAEDSAIGELVRVEEPKEEVFSVIHIKNLNVLKQQLNGASFRDTIARLEKIISDVMVLYSGHQFQLIENYYILKFHTHNNRGEALFNATCGAYLILELAGILDNIPLDLAALVSAKADDLVPEKLPFAGLIVESTAGSEELINRRIEFMELGTEDGRSVLAGFKQPFRTLLENQRQQLAQIL